MDAAMRDTGLAECVVRLLGRAGPVEQRQVSRYAGQGRGGAESEYGLALHRSPLVRNRRRKNRPSSAPGRCSRRACLVPRHRTPAGWPKTAGEDGVRSSGGPLRGAAFAGPLLPIHLVQRTGRAECHRLRDAGAARPFRTLRRYNPWLHSPPMQQLGPKTNQQKTHAPSSGANAFNTPVESAWTTAAFVAVRPVGPASPTAERPLGSALLSPVRSGLQAPAVVPDTRRTGPGSAVINVTPGSVV